eukprot:symbB.v1.2.023319.t1/scaffold2124.1/size88503/1
MALSPSSSRGATSVVPEAQTPGDRVLKRVVWNFLHRLSAPTPLSGDVAGNLAAPGPVVGPWRSTCRLVRRIFGVEQRLQNRAEMLHQALIDLALTKEQQEAWHSTA